MFDGENSEGRVHILSVGTRILLKDVMDQYLRTLGDYKTHYASNMSSALRLFSENSVQILFSEVDLDDGNVFRLVRELGGHSATDDDMYLVLAVEEKSPEIIALSEELGAQAILVKPFSASEIQNLINNYTAWKAMPKDPWILLLQEADLAIRDRRYRDAEVAFQQAIAVSPNHPEPLYRSGMYYLGKQDYPIAEPMLKKSVEMKPTYAKSWGALAQIALAKNDLPRATELLTMAQKLSPYNTDRMVDFIKLYIQLGIDQSKLALKFDRNHIAARAWLGKLLILKKDYINAMKEFEKLLAVAKDDTRAEYQTYIAVCKKLGGFAK